MAQVKLSQLCVNDYVADWDAVVTGVSFPLVDDGGTDTSSGVFITLDDGSNEHYYSNSEWTVEVAIDDFELVNDEYDEQQHPYYGRQS